MNTLLTTNSKHSLYYSKDAGNWQHKGEFTQWLKHKYSSNLGGAWFRFVNENANDNHWIVNYNENDGYIVTVFTLILE